MVVEVGRRLKQMLAYPGSTHQHIASVAIGHSAILTIRDMLLRMQSVSLFTEVHCQECFSICHGVYRVCSIACSAGSFAPLIAGKLRADGRRLT